MSVVMEEQDTEPKQEKRKPEKWKCPECGERVTTHVPLLEDPVCRSKTKHVTRGVQMVKVN